jgi:hypothetical protein
VQLLAKARILPQSGGNNPEVCSMDAQFFAQLSDVMPLWLMQVSEFSWNKPLFIHYVTGLVNCPG